MASLYDDQEDPLDGVITALQGIDLGATRYVEGRRQARQDELLAKDRETRLMLAAQQASIRRDALKQRTDELARLNQRDAGSRGVIQAGLEAEFGAGVNDGQVGPMQDGYRMPGQQSILDPGTRAAFEGMRPFFSTASPEAMVEGGKMLRNAGSRREFEKLRDGVVSEVQAIGAPMNPDGTPGEQPTDSVGMLGGFHDPSETAAMLTRAKNAKTPEQLARVQNDLKELQDKRKNDVLMAEFKANARAELEPLFAEADQMNAQRVAIGLPSNAMELYAARAALMDILRPGRIMTQEQLFSDVDQLRTRLARLRLGDISGESSSRSSKAPEAEVGSRAYYDFVESNPHAQFEHLRRQSEYLPEEERRQWVDDRFAEWKQRHATPSQSGGVTPEAGAVPQAGGSASDYTGPTDDDSLKAEASRRFKLPASDPQRLADGPAVLAWIKAHRQGSSEEPAPAGAESGSPGAPVPTSNPNAETPEEAALRERRNKVIGEHGNAYIGKKEQAELAAIREEYAVLMDARKERESAAAKAEADKSIDEQFFKSAIQRWPTTPERWLDDVRRVRDISDGPHAKDGMSQKANRLLLKLLDLGTQKGWSE